MAIPIINDTTLGGNIGQALGAGIQQLAAMKLQGLQNQIQQSQVKTGLKSLIPGLPENQYEALSQTPMELLQPYLKQELARPEQEALARALGVGGQEQQPGQPAPRLSPQNAIKLQELQLKKEKTKAQELKDIRAANKPALDALAMDISEAEKVKKKAENALKVIKGLHPKLKGAPEPTSGLYGYIPPKLTQNPSSLRLDKYYKDLATLFATAGKGQATNYKLRLAQARKPELTDPKEVQEGMLQELIEEADEIISKGSIRDELLHRKGGEPERIGDEIERIFKEKQTQQAAQKPQSHEIGTIIEFDDGSLKIAMGDHWEDVDINDPRVQAALQGA